MFYEDQHKLAAYLERTWAEWEYQTQDARWLPQYGTPTGSVRSGFIRPVLRYNLPSHLQSEIHNPDNLTEDQICEGGKYRCAIASENDGRFGTFKFNQCQVWDKDSSSWKPTLTEMLVGKTIRLPATVPWPDWEQKEVTKSFPTVEAMLGDLGTSKEVTDRLAELKESDAKDARIAELEGKLEEARAQCDKYVSLIFQIYHATGFLDGECELKGVKRLRAEYDAVLAQLATSPWRRMSEVPTEEDFEGGDGYIVIRLESGSLQWLHQRNYISSTFPASFLAWMPVPKFHGWPDPLADLLKEHGVEVTPELTAALNAWKGVEK